jgi:hypothetical protein
MISVKLRERPRIFDLYVGAKHIGRVKALWEGYCESLIISDEKLFCNIGSGRTIREAAQVVMRRAGYGASDGFDVQRLPSA